MTTWEVVESILLEGVVLLQVTPLWMPEVPGTQLVKLPALRSVLIPLPAVQAVKLSGVLLL